MATPMGITVLVWQLDEQRVDQVSDDMPDTRRSLIAPGTRELDLDQSWEGIAAMLAQFGIDDPFSHAELLAPEVKRMARILEPLAWEKAERMCEQLGAPVRHPFYVGEYYAKFRDLVLEAARAGRRLAIKQR